MLFNDPNGVRLEFARQLHDGEEPWWFPCVVQTIAQARSELATLPGAASEWIERRLAALLE
jgi:hypothetical protein